MELQSKTLNNKKEALFLKELPLKLMKESKIFTINIKGKHALFTRPEFKSERFSYHIPTHSGLRGLLESVLWKPAISWQIHNLSILEPIKFISFRRNEVGSKAVAPSKAIIKDGGQAPELLIEQDRVVRNTVALKDVEYVIQASFTMTKRASTGDNLKKFEEMFIRRMEKGQYFHHPYLGCREFEATVELLPDSHQCSPYPVTKDFGIMVWDISYSDGDRKTQSPVFFNAKMENGVIQYPQSADEAILTLNSAFESC